MSTPPASITAPLLSPLITAASLAPVMVMVISLRVGAVLPSHRDGVLQRLPGRQRLHGGIGVVERVGPGAVGRNLEGAVAVGAGGAGRDRLQLVLAGVLVGHIEIAGRGSWTPSSVTAPDTSPVMTAGPLVPVMVMVISCVSVPSCRRHRDGVLQRLPGRQRLHGGIGVVERVGPGAVGQHLEGAVAVGAGGAGCDRLQLVLAAVLVGHIEIAGRGLDAVLGRPPPDTSPVISAASLAPVMVMVTSCAVPSVVSAMKLSISVTPALSACTVALLLSSV